MDELIERLRARAADPTRRVDIRQSAFVAGLQSVSVSSLLGQLQQARIDLDRAVAASRTGKADPAVTDRADAVAAAMSAPASTGLPALDRAESELGVRLPPLLHRVYEGIADGGFGPGRGLLPIERMARRYVEL